MILLHNILEEGAEEAFYVTPEEETREENEAESASKTVHGKTTKKVVVETLFKEK